MDPALFLLALGASLVSAFVAYLLYGLVRPLISNTWRREIEAEDEDEEPAPGDGRP